MPPETPLAVFNPQHAAIGSSVSRTELMVGWENELRNRPPEFSELVFLPEFVFIRLFPTSYATDALNPLDLEFKFTDLVHHGVVLSENPLLGAGGVKLIDLTFHLHRPPQFWVRVNGLRRRGTDRDTLEDGGYEGDGVKRRGFKGVTSSGEPSALRLGRWLSYRLSLLATDLPRLQQALKTSDLLRVFPRLSNSETARPRIAELSLLDREFPPSLPFSIRYAVDGLLSFGVIIDAQVPEILECVEAFSEVYAERILRTFFRSTRIWDVRSAIDRVKGAVLERPFHPPLPHMVFVAKAVVTPTRVLLYPSECQTSNFVLRRFPKQTLEGRFIRVQLWDESNRLNMNYDSKTDDADMQEGIIARFRRTLEYGLEFGGRRYHTLEYSASQARTHAYWAVCEDADAGFTRKAIRDFLGDFSKEKVIAKNSARRGQLLSTTRDCGVVHKVTRIPDFCNGSATYSDGVGICSSDLAETAALTLGLDPQAAQHTSAIQFRLGGMKGMLVAWPPRPLDGEGKIMFPGLPWPKVSVSANLREIQVRPSQVKFQSAHARLGVVKVSVFSWGYLNREVLTLIYPRGIRHSDILNRFEKQIREVVDTEASLLKGVGPQSYHSRLFSQSNTPILPLLEVGFHKEPFVLSLARLFVNRALWDLKWRARIFIEDAVTLLGVIDELGVLEEGQCYCRALDKDGNDRVVTGQCIIYRAPTRHPGDVQLVQAVDHPALVAANLVNVIVFNRKGPRDLPSMLGGGDLDGDDYTLIWDRALVRITLAQPMSYNAPPPPSVDAVLPKDIREFHTTYMKKDTLGAISNSHLAIADKLGPDHPDCLDLAELHSVAVDFAKSGVPATLPRDLRPEAFPDFMGPRRSGNVYDSQKPLGQMFRHPALNPFPEFQHVTDTFSDPRLTLQLKEPYLREAAKLKAKYDVELRGLMTQFQAREVEVVAGLVLELPGGLRRLDKDNKLRDPMSIAFEALKFDFVSAARNLVGEGKEMNQEISRLEVFAVACYQVTHEQANRLVNPSKRMISFPFIFSEELIAVAVSRSST